MKPVLLCVLCVFVAIPSQVVVEFKAARAIDDKHIAQILGYLKATKFEPGLLINFGA